MARENLLLLAIFIIMFGCTSSTDTLKTEGKASESVLSMPELKFRIDPESLEIKEICKTPHDCTFRQKCGRIQLTFTNLSNRDIALTKISRELKNKDGVIDHSYTLDMPNGGFIIPAGEEVVPTHLDCSCRAEDKFCTPEYPHPASPFLWQRHELITVYYKNADGKIETIEAEGEYNFIKD